MIKVSLRQKKLNTNKISLYLDYYPPIIDPNSGKTTRREFLNIHLYQTPKNQEEKNHNKESLSFAQAIRSKREVQLRNKEFGFKENVLLNIDLVELYKEIVEEYYNKGSKSNYLTWNSSLKHFTLFSNNKVMSKNIDLAYIEKYKNFLLKTSIQRNLSAPKKLSVNTASTYFNKFMYVVKEAYKRGYLEKDFSNLVNYIKTEETYRYYLTEEELDLLWNTEIDDIKVKIMAIFSALTGLRFKEINSLKWSDIYQDKHQGYYIFLKQSKTKSVFNHPISDQAFELLKSVKSEGDLIFGHMSYSQVIRCIKNWISNAKINKDISFHNFRHSYATLQLANGSDIYTVSKLLGHKNVSTTQIYTKILDKNKINSTNRIKLNLHGL